MRFYVTDFATGETREIDLDPVSHPWSLGMSGSGATIELDEPALARVSLRIEWGGHHVFLLGEAASRSLMPEVFLYIPHEERWHSPSDHPWYFEDGAVYVRFDYHPLRIGRFALQVHGGPCPPWRPRPPTPPSPADPFLRRMALGLLALLPIAAAALLATLL